MTAAVAGVPGGGLGKEEQPQDPGGPGASEGVTPLMYACQQGRDHTVRQILHRKPNSIQERDRTGKTALHYCAENPTLACIDQVVEADPSLLRARDEDGYTPLHLATIAGNRTVAKYLLTKDADVKALDNEKHTVVHWATVCGEVELLDLLIEAGADPSTPDIHGAYPLHYAAQMCGPNSEMGNDVRVGLMVLRKLLQRGVDVSVTDHDGRQPLLWAASAGSADALLALINAGASVSAEDKDGLTALHCAASRGHLDCLDCLVNFCGAEVDTLDSNGCTPLFYAVTLGHADCTQLLLHHGAHPDKQDRKGRTPAHCGAAKGQLETLKLLHRKGADLWKRNVKGDLPLHEACQSGRKDLVLWLLSMRPDTVNAPNLDGRCPLHIAAINNNIEMCKILMDKQAAVNPIMRNSRGQLLTPLDAGVARGNRGCAKYLQLHGGVAASKLTDKHALQKAMQRALETKQHSNTGATPSELTGDELVVSSSASSALKSNRSTMTASPVNTEAQTDTVDLKNKENMQRKVTQRDAQTGTSEVNIRKLVLEEEAAELARKKAEEQRIAEEKNEEEEEQGKQKTAEENDEKETDEEEIKRKRSADKEESQTEGDAEGSKKVSADEEEIEDESKRDSGKKEESEDGAGAAGLEEKGGEEDPSARGSVPEGASDEPGSKASSGKGSKGSDGDVEEEGAEETTKGRKGSLRKASQGSTNEAADDGDGEEAGKNGKTEESEDTNRTSQEALQRKSEDGEEEGGQTQVDENVEDGKDNNDGVDASVTEAGANGNEEEDKKKSKQQENAENKQGKKDGEEADDNETDGDKKDSSQEAQDGVDANENNKKHESDQSVEDSNRENGDEEDAKDGKTKKSNRKVSIAMSGSEGSGGGSLEQDPSLSHGEEGSASSAQNTVISNTSKQQSSLEEGQEGSPKSKSKKSRLVENGKTIDVDEDETEADGDSATEQEESAGRQANSEDDDEDKEFSGKDEGDEDGYEDQEDGQETEEGQNGQRAARAAGLRARPKSAVRPGTLSKKVGNRKTKGGAGKRTSLLKRRSTQDDSRGDDGEPVHKNTTRRVSISKDLPHLGSLRDTQEDDDEGVERPPMTASEERSHEMLLESSGRDFLTVDAAPPGLSSPSSTHGRDTGDSGFKRPLQESGYSDTLAVERDSDVDGPTDPERHTEDEDTPHASRRKTKTRRRRNKEREERYGAGTISEDGDGRIPRAGRGDVADDGDDRGPRRKRDLRARQEGVDAPDEGGRGTDDSPPGTFDEDDDEEADEDALRKLGVTSHRRPGVRRGQVRSGAMSGGPKKVENMESSLRRRSRKAASPSTEVSITQAMQNTMRKYALERRLFQQLLELKRMQIRNTRANEHVLIKRMVDSFHKEGNLLGMRGYGGPYSFSSYEKYLYDQLRFLQSSQGVKIPSFRPSDDVEKLSRAIRRAEIKELPEPLMTHRDPTVCNHTTHRCHHAAHAYTGVPCAAYIGYHRRRKASNNNNNNNNKQVSLPRIAGSTAGGGTAGGTAGASPGPPQEGARVSPGEPIGLRNYDPKKPLTVELQHGLARQQIVLPTDILDKNKKYHLTFSIKPSSPVPVPPQSPLKEEVVPAERSASAPEIIEADTLAPDARQDLLHSAPPEGRTEA